MASRSLPATVARGNYRSKSVRLAEEFLAEIAAQRWVEGGFIPPETVLAERFRSARLTVRKALAQLEEQHRLRRIPHQGLVVNAQDGSSTHAPAVRHRHATQLPAGRLTVAMVSASAPDEGASRMLAGIEGYCREQGISLQSLSANDDPEQPFAVLSDVEAMGVSGVVVLPYPGPEHRELLAGLHARRFPLVCIERRSSELQVPSVEIDNRTGMYRAVNHLLTSWRRPVYYLGMRPAHRTDAERYDGYRRAMQEAGYAAQVESHTCFHAMDSADPRYWHVEDPWRQGYEVALELLAKHEGFLSVACQKDHIAWGLYRAAAERGLAIGRQIAVTGFDDHSVAQQLDPPLTTVHQPFFDKGYKAAWLLHRRMMGAVDRAIQLTIPIELVVRGSG
jgi:LacI family transcriptional regulator